MALIPRWMFVGMVVCVSALLGACSTLKLRGQTQSVDNTSYYVPPSYAGYQDARPRQAAPHYGGARSDRGAYPGPQATVRYHDNRSRQPVEQMPRYQEPAYQEPARRAPPRDRFYTTPPERSYAPPRERSYVAPREPAYRPPKRTYRPQQEGSYATPPRVERQYQRRNEQRVVEQAPEGGEPQYQRRGGARWIGRSWFGHQTTSGEMFDAERLTGAHASLPIPSFLYVTNRRNGRTVLIRINDRVPASSDRVVIVSERTAKLLGFRGSGREMVDLQYAGPAAPTANQKHELAFLQQQPWFRPSMFSNSRHARRTATPSRRSGRYPAPTYPRWDNTQR